MTDTSHYQSFISYIRCELNLSAHTVLSYSGDLNQWQRFVGERFGDDYDVEQATANDLRLWIAELARAGVSQRSIRRKVSTLRSFFNFMMTRRGMTANPAAEIQPARLPKSLPRTVAPADTAAVIRREADCDEFEQTRNLLIVDMLYSTGMRAAELVGLLDCNINTTTCELKVVGKRNKERVIPFAKPLRDMIIRYRNLRPQANPEGYFFVGNDGHHISYGTVNAAVKSEFADTRSHPTPHCLRHSCATDMLNAGADLMAVKELLGHASLATTQIYTHLSYSELKQNYQLAHPRAQKKR